MTHTHTPLLSRESSPDLAGRLTDIGWALFFILTGVLWLLPSDRVPPGTWLLSTGILLLGLNLIRILVKVPSSPALLTLGGLAVLAGLSALLGIKLPIAAICLIGLGAAMLLRQVKRHA